MYVSKENFPVKTDQFCVRRNRCFQCNLNIEEKKNEVDERRDHHFFHNIKWREVILYLCTIKNRRMKYIGICY
ncbi:hypothetical protein DRN97_07620 [Methanosarcinales archaeon]|nr:MAG: hypothetical protein DRN97_07620 [Methanosarcinales archaeon]